MANDDVSIRIGASFVGKKAFKEADSATTKLNNNVKKLAGSIGLAYGTRAVVAYGKAAVRAFSEDEAAALRLNRAVENLGIGFANPAIADYIGNLERSAGVADDILRPAFQSLLTTTGSLTKSQELLNNAIQISRASGVDLATVSEDLAKGYIGVTKGLTKYNTGLTKAELQSKSFSDILGVLLARSAGAAEDYLSSTSYQMNVLSIATGNASEIIGGGLVDAFARIGGGTEASDAAVAIESIAGAIAKITVATGTAIGAIPNLLKNLKNLPKNIFMGFAGKQAGVNVDSPQKKENKLTLTQIQQQEALAKLESAAAKRNRELLALKNKQVAADKAKAIIAKGEAALLKGQEVFDMDKIQIAAALTSQAEQLGKATTSSQVLQIANDTARLNVKKSILALEDAIAAKDEKAIIAATAKLNADLKVLGTLGMQEVKLNDIKSILDSLKPKDLINLMNLEAALALLGKINLASTGSIKAPTGTTTTTPPPNLGLGGSQTDAAAERAARLAASTITSQTPSFTTDSAASYRQGLIGGQTSKVEITVVAPPFTDPNAVAEAIDQLLIEATQRGTLRAGVYE